MISSRTIRAITIRAVLLVTSLVVCLGLVEMMARQALSHVSRRGVSLLDGALDADPEMLVEYTARGRRFVPNADVVIHNHYISGADVDIQTNSLGLRNREFDPSPRTGTERILFVGDSIVAQDYLPSEKTSSRLLEEYFRTHLNRPVEVINAGLSNFGLEDEIQLVEDIIKKVNPTRVLLSFYLNDSRPAWGFSGELGERRGWLRKHSIIVETVMRELELRNWMSDAQVDRFSWMKLIDTLPWKTSPEAFREVAAAAPYDWGAAWSDESWGRVTQGLTTLNQLARSHNAELMVITMPVRYQVYTEYVDDLPQLHMRRIAESLKIPEFSLLEVLRSHNSEELFFDWCHPNDRGNQVVVTAIGDFILKRIKGERE